MRTGTTDDTTIHKEVVVIGNGPSGIVLSFMLSGHLPYLVSDQHPDDMFSLRLRPAVGRCLLELDLAVLSAGLEGRSTNQVALLMDALLHPCADIGLELEPLVEFRKAGVEIDHIVLGKGPPGGSWHRMDPHILTLSLGSWMALPGLPFDCRDSDEKRAFACSVAKYYEQYVEKMHLTKYFKCNVEVTSVKPINQDNKYTSTDYLERSRLKKNNWLKKFDDDIAENEKLTSDPQNEENIDGENTCFISNAINFLLSRRKNRCCKRSREQIYEKSPTRKIRELEKTELEPSVLSKPTKRDKMRSISFCCNSNNFCDSLYSKSFNENSHFNPYALRNSCSLDFSKSPVPFCYKYSYCDSTSKWTVHTYDIETGKETTYTCKYLILANGASDLPNRLDICKEKEDPSWLVHDLRNLENKLDVELATNKPEKINPVLIIGAGLSAADAVIATRARNIPVIHVFRSKTAELNKQFPENMYPEYHKVHQMMKDGRSTHPNYTAYPEYSLTGINDKSRTVILTSKSGEQLKTEISFAAILIGSRPDLSFLPSDYKIAVKKDQPVDSKTNTIDIDKSTYKVNGYENLFAVGPLAGDNFVRFISGGALAVVFELYKQHNSS